jgi:hypothetical protein
LSLSVVNKSAIGGVPDASHAAASHWRVLVIQIIEYIGDFMSQVVGARMRRRNGCVALKRMTFSAMV